MAKPRLTKEEKALQAKVVDIVKVAIKNVQIGVFDLGKVFDAGMQAARQAQKEGMAEPLAITFIQDALNDIIAKVRKN